MFPILLYNNVMREIIFKIDDKNSGLMIRDFLRNFGVSSALLTKLKQDENGIKLNGKFAKAIEVLKSGDNLTINIKNSGKMPEKFECENVKVAYNDEDILVLNKPPLMPVHESRNHRGDTLANVAACYMESDCAFRAVYRLDRDTSGLVLIAKNELAASKLAGKIKKDYYAVVSGKFEGRGTIDLPIRRVQESIIERGVFDDGERAITHYEAIKTDGENTLLKLNLETGRTHQIRVHFSHLGAPLWGDTLYGGNCEKINRQALHCKTIYFTHPITHEKITVDSDFPKDFKGLI
jgi:23S rRNA pseudouridine1911/1915/1917 synthase